MPCDHCAREGETTDALALLREVVEESPVEGGTGVNFCRFCGHSWPDTEGGPEGHHDDCWWLRAKAAVATLDAAVQDEALAWQQLEHADDDPHER